MASRTVCKASAMRQHATLCEFALLGQLTQIFLYLVHVLVGVLNTVLGEVLS